MSVSHTRDPTLTIRGLPILFNDGYNQFTVKSPETSAYVARNLLLFSNVLTS